MRHQWFSSSTSNPRLAFTFHLLDFFHKLTHKSKANIYDFYHTLESITDGSGVRSLPVSVKAFSYDIVSLFAIVSIQAVESCHATVASSSYVEVWWTWP